MKANILPIAHAASVIVTCKAVALLHSVYELLILLSVVKFVISWVLIVKSCTSALSSILDNFVASALG